MLAEGMKAPEFTLPDQNGEQHSLSDYAGKKLILYFYSKDNTSGCTKQACGFAELYHKKFEQNYGLPFTILSDPELTAIKAYDVWQEKKNYGKVTMGVVRTTYLIDEKGMIARAYGKVKAAENPQDMLNALEQG